jgi:hypothetical protein
LELLGIDGIERGRQHVTQQADFGFIVNTTVHMTSRIWHPEIEVRIDMLRLRGSGYSLSGGTLNAV